MRNGLAVLSILLCSITSAMAQVDVNIGLPGVSIGINVPVYPQLVLVPGYPVYYAPQADSNYFFYDGMYWVYQGDNWYTSSWYNGPWQLVATDAVPLFILRVPVRFYRRPPVYFHGWSADAAPRWDEHWGNAWAQSHIGWNTWNGSSVPAPAPLPAYQRQYSGNRYPTAQQQQQLQSQNYHYQPHDAIVQQHYQAPRAQRQAVTAQGKASAPQVKSSPQQNDRGFSRPPSQGAVVATREQPPQKAGRDVAKAAAPAVPNRRGPEAWHPAQQPRQAVAQHQQAAPAPKSPQSREPGPEPKQAQRPQPQLAAAQHEEQAAKPRTQEKVPQAKGPQEEPRQGQEKER